MEDKIKIRTAEQKQVNDVFTLMEDFKKQFPFVNYVK